MLNVESSSTKPRSCKVSKRHLALSSSLGTRRRAIASETPRRGKNHSKALTTSLGGTDQVRICIPRRAATSRDIKSKTWSQFSVPLKKSNIKPYNMESGSHTRIHLKIVPRPTMKLDHRRRKALHAAKCSGFNNKGNTITRIRNGIREKRGGPILAALSPCQPHTEIRIASYGGELWSRTLTLDLVRTLQHRRTN